MLYITFNQTYTEYHVWETSSYTYRLYTWSREFGVPTEPGVNVVFGGWLLISDENVQVLRSPK